MLQQSKPDKRIWCFLFPWIHNCFISTDTSIQTGIVGMFMPTVSVPRPEGYAR